MNKANKLLYESGNSHIYYQEDDNYPTPVIIKVLKADYPTHQQIVQFNNEYKFTKDFNIAGIRKTYQQTRVEGKSALVLEYFDGKTIKHYLEITKPTVANFLEIATKIAQTLGDIHQQNIIHKDVNSNNILINPDSHEIKIIDFGIASKLDTKIQHLGNPEMLEGTLAYISPEQTGRMNRVVDYRTDLYSLGIVFYEMLTGKLPFVDEDAMSIVHSHLAKEAKAVHEVNSDVPIIISDIVAKLMSKDPGDRYQSGYGLKADLEYCIANLKNLQDMADFNIGSNDFSRRFQLPQKLYGRESEIKSLMQTFDDISTGSKALMLVSGYSGIGKSSLVVEIHKPIAEKRGYFISGKFDQLQRNIPYKAIAAAFQDLVQQLLTESEAKLERWRKELLMALGPNGQVIVDVIPELTLIIGEQLPVTPLNATESQNRFNLVFQNFLHVFCQSSHPLVIFLDDLQWVDAASLNLIELMMMDETTHHFLLIGAYRDNEVDDMHPLIMTLDKLRNANITMPQIIVMPLEKNHVTNLIADTLHHPPQHVLPLTNQIMEKTRGNPFFVNEFLETVYQENGFVFRTDNGHPAWQWDLSQIKAMNITDNVVNLMIGRLQKLPSETQQLLRLAACMGNEFDMDTLSIIQGQAITEIYPILMPAIRGNLIQPISALESADATDVESPLLYRHYRFRHDRIQQSAYILISEEDKKQVHLKIGRLLFADTKSSNTVDEHIFDIVNHLNEGQALMSDDEEKYTLAGLNLKAGLKAKSALAYQPAVKYLTSAKELLSSDMQTHYRLTFDVYKALAESAFLTGDFEQADALYPTLLAHAESNLDKIQVYFVQMEQYQLQGKYLDALHAEMAGLALLGIDVPESAEGQQSLLGEELGKVQVLLGDRVIADLLDLPEMTSSEHQATMHLLMGVWISAYLSANQTLVGWSSVKMTNLSLEYGNSDISSFGYVNYGFVACGIIGDYQTGYQFGKMAVALSDKFDNASVRGKVYYLFGATVSYWQEPLSNSIDYYLKSNQFCFESGDFIYASYNAIYLTSDRLMYGHDLTKTYQESQQLFSLLSRTNTATLGAFYQPGCFCAVQNLLGLTHDTDTYSTESFDESAFLDMFKEAPLVLGWFYFPKLRSLYLFGHYYEALAKLDMVTLTVTTMPGSAKIPDAYFFACLTLATVYPDATPEEQTEYWAIIEKYHEEIKAWADGYPQNFLHKYLLVEAEKCRIQGKDSQAMTLYEQGIESAKANGYINNQAVGNELAAKFYLSKGMETVAAVYMKEAHYAYQLWGAKAKVDMLAEQYPTLLAKFAESRPKKSMTNTTWTTTRRANVTRSFSMLDIEAVVKASQVIFSEIDLSKLLTNLMKMVIQSAGAEHGILILRQDKRWYLQAKADINSVQVLQEIPLDFSQHENLAKLDVSAEVVNYIIRSKQSVVLDDAVQNSQFGSTPYIVEQQTKSLLGMPLVNQGKVRGILYLENNLSTHVFTPERTELLQVLSIQIAISLDNAMVYRHLEDLVDQRTKELRQALENLQATQAQLVESEKMAALGGLVAGVAHEINTPLGVGITAASVLADETKQVVDTYYKKQLRGSDLKEYFETATQVSNSILTNLQRAGELIQSFKLVAVDQSDLNKRTFQVKAYLEEVLISLNPQLKYTSLIVSIKGDDTITMKSFAGAISQVITNLIVNSINHAYPEIHKGNLTIELEQQNGQVVIVYADDGCGIPEANLKKIFDPFFTTARNQGGTGLGLHIVYNLVTQKLGGTISCESEVGVGTKFTITLPLTLMTRPLS